METPYQGVSTEWCAVGFVLATQSGARCQMVRVRTDGQVGLPRPCYVVQQCGQRSHSGKPVRQHQTEVGDEKTNGV